MRIFVKAFLDKNLGDDLMLFELFDAFPNDCFTLSCNNEYAADYRRLFANQNHVTVTRTELWQIHTFGKGYFDVILQIGGSILQGSRNIGCYYRWRNIRAVCAQKKYGTHYYITGCNVGPFINRLTQLFVRLEIMSCNGISVRDQASYRFIKKGLTRNIPVVWADDLLMGYVRRYAIHAHKSEAALGVSVMLPRGMEAQRKAIIRAYANICNGYIAKTDQPIKLLCYDSGIQNDRSIAEAVIKKCFAPDHISIVSYENGNYSTVIAETISCEAVIATRFHSMILALSAKIPVYPIIYSNKMQNVLNDMGQGDCGMTIEQFANGGDRQLLGHLMRRQHFVYRNARTHSSNKHFAFIKKLQETL